MRDAPCTALLIGLLAALLACAAVHAQGLALPEVARLYLDDAVQLSQLTTEVVESLSRMAPHGPGNQPPRLATTEVELAGAPRVVGRAGNHLQFNVRQGRVHRKAIAFGFGEQADELVEHHTLRLAFEPIINEWNGRRSVELKVIDWKWARP